MDEKELAKSKENDTKAQKEKEKELKKRQKEEQKKANKIVLSPFKSLLLASLMFTIIGFLVFYFGSEFDIVESSYRAFLIFSTIYVGIGLIVLIFFYSLYRIKVNESKKENDRNGSQNFDYEEDEMDRIMNESIQENE
jgi:H+/gluconate symporter-like permease